MAQSVVDLELGELDGIGSATKQKLKDAGVETILDLAASLPSELVDQAGVTDEKASAIIYAARRSLMDNGLLDQDFVRADEVLERRQKMLKCSTGSKNLDALLNGGIETQAITEFYGDFGSGKSQICHTLCTVAQLDAESSGLGGGVIFIDTEGTFRPERVKQIAEESSLDDKKILKNILLCKVYNAAHLELIVKMLGKVIEENKVKMVIVDSIISLHRAEFTGRGTLAERQQKLNRLVHRLMRMAEIYNIAVVVTNQVQSTPDTMFGDPTKPAGGNVIAHACTYRVYLKKAGHDRIATIVDSPYHPYSDVRFRITEKGIEDSEEKEKKTSNSETS